jgi:hypothetical protein
LAYLPLNLLFLWVFGSLVVENTARRNLGKVWRYIGTVRLLKGARYMVGMGDMVATLRGRAGERVEKTPREVNARIQSFRMTPDWLGRYPLNSILCADATWQLALHTLLSTADVVLINLTGFSPKNQGVIYELTQLVDRVPTKRFLLIVDGMTELEFLTDTLRRLWEAIAADSPNRLPNAAPIQIFKVEEFNKPYDYEPNRDSHFVDYDVLQKEIDGIFQLLCEGAAK